jgi:hypothetical protein
MNFSSSPRYTVFAPRTKSDLTHAGSSLLSAGTSFSNSTASNGPAITGRDGASADAAAAPIHFNASRRFNEEQQPEDEQEEDGGGFMD